ncbi:hypothetical protein Uis4E_2127 [Bifidobacterium parmae]|uniref:Uncharacterized protein n=2 Tax=Bifidobacterium parmae TaxID=361854 RepID=A0A2N5IVT8_9BIFI|nr:hypothetical protein Uis4E_2127 [Bifidobacterium parmae]
MKAEQRIYTSCNKGISGNTSGFQVYSQSPGMARWLADGNDLGPQEYAAPRGPQFPPQPGTPEELALYPSRNHFGPMNGPDGLYRMALATYIGRDYPEGVIRGGNYIDHALVVRAADMDAYPCQYIQSPTFWTTMDLNLARSAQAPEPLPEVEPRRNGVTAEAVRRFIAQDEPNIGVPRSQILTDMLRRFLGRHTTVAGKPYTRRIVIRCSADDFTMWVSAIQMALPIRQALGYGFSTYEKDITYANADIVRAVDGINGMSADLTASCAVFDLLDPSAPQPPHMVFGADEPTPEASVLESLTADELCTFIVGAMQYSPDSLTVFHRFLDETDYAGTDTQLGAAYALLRLVNGMTPFARMDADSIDAAIAFLQRHCRPDMWRRFADGMFRDIASTTFDERRLGIIANTLGGIAESDPDYAATATQRCLDLIVDVFSTSAPDHTAYEQRHAIAANVFAAAHRDLDTELFARLADNPNIDLGDGAAPGTPMPWTAHVVAAWFAGAVRAAAQATRGDDPLGRPLSVMVQAVGTRNTLMMDRLVRVVIAHDGDADASRLVDGMARALAPIPWAWFLFLIDVMSGSADARFVDSPNPAARPSQAAAACYAMLRDWYLAQDDDARLRCLRTLCGDAEYHRLADLLLDEQARLANTPPSRFLDLLATPAFGDALSDTYRQAHLNHLLGVIETAAGRDGSPFTRYHGMVAASRLLGANVPRSWYERQIADVDAGMPLDARPGDDYDRLRDNTLQLCGQLGTPVPPRMRLVGYRRLVTSLARSATAKRPDENTANVTLRRIQASAADLPLTVAGNQLDAYLGAIARDVAACVPTGRSCWNLQAIVVPREHTATIIRAAMRETAAHARVDDILLLIAVDAGFVDGTQGVRYRADQLARAIAEELAGNGVRLKTLARAADDKRQMDKLIARYERSYGIRFPDRSFDELYNGIVAALEATEQRHRPSILGSVQGIFGGKRRH